MYLCRCCHIIIAFHMADNNLHHLKCHTPDTIKSWHTIRPMPVKHFIFVCLLCSKSIDKYLWKVTLIYWHVPHDLEAGVFKGSVFQTIIYQISV